jgi:hypothetical protein
MAIEETLKSSLNHNNIPVIIIGLVVVLVVISIIVYFATKEGFSSTDSFNTSSSTGDLSLLSEPNFQVYLNSLSTITTLQSNVATLQSTITSLTSRISSLESNTIKTGSDCTLGNITAETISLSGDSTGVTFRGNSKNGYTWSIRRNILDNYMGIGSEKSEDYLSIHTTYNDLGPKFFDNGLIYTNSNWGIKNIAI